MGRKNILITGASSGIGKALAVNYASQGVNLFLFGRAANKLKDIADSCLALGAACEYFVVDVKDKILMQSIIEKISCNYKMDIVICSAGISAGTLNHPESSMQITEIFEVNLNGTLNTILPIIPHMIENKNGNIVLISSMAGLIGLSSSPSYSASKAAVKILGDGLRSYLKRFGLRVNVVLPGYVNTPMTAVNNFPMPLMMSAEKAAQIIVHGIKMNHGIIAFPKITYFLMKFLNILPYRLLDFINSKLPGKTGLKHYN